MPNVYGKEPFDADITVFLDEINEEDTNFIMRSTQKVNKEQLINSVFNYLTTMAKNVNTEQPKKEDLNDLGNEIETASRIHDSGWVVYSFQTVTVTSSDITRIEERVIEIK